jgi:hypothetical protein
LFLRRQLSFIDTLSISSGNRGFFFIADELLFLRLIFSPLSPLRCLSRADAAPPPRFTLLPPFIAAAAGFSSPAGCARVLPPHYARLAFSYFDRLIELLILIRRHFRQLRR